MPIAHADLRAVAGVLDRQAMRPALEAVAQATRGSGRSLALLTLDIDHFKDYQDEHGPAQAQQVLTQLAMLLQQLLPPGASLAYMGADEFVVILPETSLAAAAELGERLRDRIASALAQLGGLRPLTATVGVAASPPNQGWQANTLLALADARMTFAKRRLLPHHNLVWAGTLPSDWYLRLEVQAGVWPSL
ncbi:GGDEF domain-containing protein [Pelomonas sp. SE-A7]|uniref:GGDEF domain-containing protein n=1 Tax=Pelomonas sp. SE-A7 TaxID=3054953 RepID=UPI00259C8D6F|nr:GGDEF domain-containing protein [Pelomonas sp. SE-A7]MDM4767418.1 GGDEF domain-containing protein [Pelomonas sp. SE-A7]